MRAASEMGEANEQKEIQSADYRLRKSVHIDIDRQDGGTAGVRTGGRTKCVARSRTSMTIHTNTRTDIDA